jgi:3-oxoacyl-[acyl-carrier protein] reductase
MNPWIYHEEFWEMDLGIKGKVALVIGGTQGIGLACSQALAAEGTKVFTVSRNQKNIDDAVASIKAEGGEAAGVPADCLTKEGIEDALAGVRKAYGSPDIFVYIPYATIMGRIEDVTDEDFAAGDNSMVLQFMRLCRAVLPHMKEQRWGRIVTIGSMAVRQTHRHVPHAVPNAYRLAAIGLSKTMSDEYAQYGITVNTVATGSIATENFKTTFREIAERNNEDYEEMLVKKSANIPAKRFGTPEEMAAVCAFLCSAPASYVTGTTILVDGGKVEVPI